MADDRLPSRPKTTIEIPLHSIRKYVPGSGPPPPRISLAPPRDSTAYIIDQFILPSGKDMTATSRRLIHYHIGFTDLPTVKLLIPCNKVLDYVSPRELEDWEYRNLEKKEEERARLLAERQGAGPKEKKKKPGRPAKIPRKDTGGSVLNAADEALLLAQEFGGPSLSTPQKRNPERALADGEIGESTSAESDDAAILRQLEGRERSADMESDDNMEVGSESVNQRALHHVGKSVSALETPSLVGRSISRPSQDTLPQRPAIPQGSSVTSSGPAASNSLSNAPNTERIHPAWAQAFGRQMDPEKHPEEPGAAETASHSSGSLARKRKERAPNGGSSAQKQQQAKKQKIRQEDGPPADEWEVKELLDDQWFVEEGTRVHKYLVLWEGDWPEDQNPTWEPAENVQDQRLINRYQQKKKTGLLKPQKNSQKTLHQYWAGARYSSVAEAFEAGIDERAGVIASGAEREADQPDEMLLVTENVKDIAPSPGFVFDSLLARHNQAFQRG
ncbi:uncharacterized protein P884DRAFT_204581 [Thermothelomyces heterothallicus CBS 202.75]|uniref:uncharacterized protein n=1 Tax=Thermothelomyces heterothallicus CBS 202.75 TaxID=1149848 RepID=UPI0037432809